MKDRVNCMENVKKNICNAVFLILVLILTIYNVFKGEDINIIFSIIKGARKEFVLFGVACVFFFIWGESIIIYYLMNSLSIRLKRWKCFLFSSVGFFFSCITPSASGGQPMQIYYMKKEKIPIPISTLVLIIITITYKFVLVVIGGVLLIGGRGFVHTYLKDVRFVFYLGILLNIFCVAFLLMLVFYPQLAKSIMINGLNILEELHILKKKENRVKKLEDSMELYKTTAEYLKSHRKIVLNVFLITFLQRIALFLTTYFVYRSFGLSGISVCDIVLLQAVISVAVDMLPLPGGMGISEKLFLTIFIPIFGMRFLLPGMVLSRGIGYYGQLLISAVMTTVAQFTLGKKKEAVKW